MGTQLKLYELSGTPKMIDIRIWCNHFKIHPLLFLQESLTVVEGEVFRMKMKYAETPFIAGKEPLSETQLHSPLHLVKA